MELRAQTLTTTTPSAMSPNIANRWRELSGENNWSGLLDPLDIDLRHHIISYGEMVGVVYQSFISEKKSRFAGAPMYSRANLFDKVGLNPKHYRVTKYFFATSSILLPGFLVQSLSREAWNKESNWIGFVAVATDEGKVALGRRDILVVWRGTVQVLESVNDLDFTLVFAPELFGQKSWALVHRGWLSIYTSEDARSPFNITSARDQVLEELKLLVEEYKDEETSITVTGHSLGAALATLNAVDIAYNCINQAKDCSKKSPVTAFVFASPRVGDFNLKMSSHLPELHVLRIHNLPDIVPKYPVVGYADIGQELMINTPLSKFLKLPGGIQSWHDLDAYLHGIAGTQGIVGDFKLVVDRDIALVNKNLDAVKDEYLIPAKWWVEKNRCVARGSDGKLLIIDHEEDAAVDGQEQKSG